MSDLYYQAILPLLPVIVDYLNIYTPGKLCRISKRHNKMLRLTAGRNKIIWLYSMKINDFPEMMADYMKRNGRDELWAINYMSKDRRNLVKFVGWLDAKYEYNNSNLWKWHAKHRQCLLDKLVPTLDEFWRVKLQGLYIRDSCGNIIDNERYLYEFCRYSEQLSNNHPMKEAVMKIVQGLEHRKKYMIVKSNADAAEEVERVVQVDNDSYL